MMKLSCWRRKKDKFAIKNANTERPLHGASRAFNEKELKRSQQSLVVGKNKDIYLP